MELRRLTKCVDKSMTIIKNSWPISYRISVALSCIIRAWLYKICTINSQSDLAFLLSINSFTCLIFTVLCYTIAQTSPQYNISMGSSLFTRSISSHILPTTSPPIELPTVKTSFPLKIIIFLNLTNSRKQPWKKWNRRKKNLCFYPWRLMRMSKNMRPQVLPGLAITLSKEGD